MEAVDLTIDKINLNDNFSFEKSWSSDDLELFAKLSGDHSPLHMDDEYASNTQFGKRVVHGALVVSSFSALIGMHVFGKRCLLVSEQFLFKEPIFIGDIVKVSGTIVEKSLSTSIVSIDVRITREEKIAVSGNIKVIVRDN